MNLPRLSDVELEQALAKAADAPFAGSSELEAFVHIARAAAEAQRLKDEQWMREQKPVAWQSRSGAPLSEDGGRWEICSRDYFEQARKTDPANVRAIYVAPVPASQGDRWLPIETAPKDGTAFLACLDGSDIPVGLRFTATGSLVLTWDGYTVNLIDWPKHWMRIPAAPVATKEAEHG